MSNPFPHLGDFFGSEESASFLDAVIASKVWVKDYRLAASLTMTRWFGYRRLSPGQAVFLFIDRYRAAYEKNAPRHWSVRWVPPFAKAHKIREWESSWGACFFAATAHADAHGIPYDFYINEFFKIAEREGWKTPPAPRSLYRPRRVAQVIDAWEKNKRDRIVFTADPMFSGKSWCDTESHREYAEHIFSSAENRPNKRAVIKDILVNHKALPAKLVVERYGIETVKRSLL